jgi:hypothetical protein
LLELVKEIYQVLLSHSYSEIKSVDLHDLVVIGERSIRCCLVTYSETKTYMIW